jgi:esterase/lipase superfamily enzyme
LFVIAAALLVAGCAGPRTHDLLNRTAIEAPQSAIAATHEIFVATTRVKATKDPRRVFNAQRSLATNFASIDMTVPKIHKVGEIERAKGRAASDPAKDFAARRVTFYGDAAQFEKAVNADIARRDGRVLVFVHGFNNGFDDGAYRITQVVHDMHYPGTPVLFSWASAGKATGYIYDKESANAARDNLEATLKMLAGTKAKSIDIIAHSMGTWVAMEALRQLAIEGNRDLDGKLGYIVLASPDIDVDVFKKQMERYGKPDEPFTVLLSGDDRALQISSFISGAKPRVGDYGNAKDLAGLGVTVVDLTNAKGSDRLNHTKFANNPLLVQLMGERLSVPASLSSNHLDGDRTIETLGRGIGQTVGSVAEIVITTPFKVLTVVAGGE